MVGGNMEQKIKLFFKTLFIKKESPKKNRQIIDMIRWGREFQRLNLAEQTTGNLSFRKKEGFVITGTGAELGGLLKDDFVEVLKVEKKNNKFLVYAKGKMFPSSETLLHWEIYQFRKDVNVIFHLHDLSVLEKEKELKIPSTQKEKPGGSYELAQEWIRLLQKEKKINYFILKNHGVIVMGKSISGAGKLVKFFNQKAKTLTKQQVVN